jgi:hypothetical protein
MRDVKAERQRIFSELERLRGIKSSTEAEIVAAEVALRVIERSQAWQLQVKINSALAAAID